MSRKTSRGRAAAVSLVASFSVFSFLYSHFHHDQIHGDFQALSLREKEAQQRLRPGLMDRYTEQTRSMVDVSEDETRKSTEKYQASPIRSKEVDVKDKWLEAMPGLQPQKDTRIEPRTSGLGTEEEDISKAPPRGDAQQKKSRPVGTVDDSSQKENEQNEGDWESVQDHPQGGRKQEDIIKPEAAVAKNDMEEDSDLAWLAAQETASQAQGGDEQETGVARDEVPNKQQGDYNGKREAADEAQDEDLAWLERHDAGSIEEAGRRAPQDGEGLDEQDEGDPDEEERLLKEEVGDDEDEATGDENDHVDKPLPPPPSNKLPTSAPSLLRKQNQSMEEALAQMDSVLDNMKDPDPEQQSLEEVRKLQPEELPPPSAGLLGRLTKLGSALTGRHNAKRGQDDQKGKPDRGSTNKRSPGLSAASSRALDSGAGRVKRAGPAQASVSPVSGDKIAARFGDLLGNPQEDDLSWPCRLSCRPHGFCRKGQCLCAAAWTGPDCKTPRQLPQNLRSEFNGEFMLNKKSVLKAGGITVVANPKASEVARSRTHTLFARFEDVQDNKQDRQYHDKSTSLNKLKPVITRGQLELLPPEDFMAETMYDTCAVVGNSGLNLVHKDGPFIDSHDAVIRFNSGPTQEKGKDYTPHVGSKTSFRFVNTQHILFREGSEWRVQQMQSKNGLYRYLNFKSRHPQSHLAGFDADFTNYVSSNIPTLPTGGYFALMFALQKCHKVNIWGFHWKPGHSIPHHYFNTEVPLKGKQMIHDYEAEHGNLEALAIAGIVELAQPCVAGCPAETGIPCIRCPPGSACACGDNLPTPMSLPGFCHMARDYKCFYRCPGGTAQCPGGPKSSRCPKSFDPEKLQLECATKDGIPHVATHFAEWTKKGFSGHGVRQADMSKFGKVSIGQVRAEGGLSAAAVGATGPGSVILSASELANVTCHSKACRKQRREAQKALESEASMASPQDQLQQVVQAGG